MAKVLSHTMASDVEGDTPAFRRRTVIIDGPDPVDKHVGGQLRLRRAQVGMTQSELGGKLGLSFQAVQKYETGENRISASRLFQLARLLEVTPSYFFEGLDGVGRAGGDGASSELSRKEASLVLGAYYGIGEPRLRSACLLIMTRMAGRAADDGV